MRKLKKISPRHVMIYVLTMLIFIVIIPSVCIRLFPVLIQNEQEHDYEGALPDTVSLYITEKGTYETIAFEDYIKGVVAAEMPASFSYEALKAQAVACRSYALGRINSGAKLCDTVHCQVYQDHDIPSKVSRAVSETKGQVLLYNNELASQALYFSSSAGDTENAEDVFSNPYPYLVSVSSSYEPAATHKREVLTLSLKELKKALKEHLPEMDFGSIKKNNIKILTHTGGGRVETLQVGDAVISGSDLRQALSLYSTRLTITTKGSKVTITTSGSGHGVGMSQYGADGLAKKGKNYTQILSHYYPGTTIGS